MRTKEFYEFMCKREEIRLKKETGAPWPWTDDKILQTYKFTNVDREHDKTTRWMREHWTGPNLNEPLGKQLFNCAFFRYFGTIEFAEAVGWQARFDSIRIIQLATNRLSAGMRVFTGAYVITNQGISAPKQEVVCNLFLRPLWEIKDSLAALALNSKSWETTANRMRQLKGFGGSGFMTKEVLQDAMHTPVLSKCKDRNTWCPLGPGARRGLNRVFDYDIKAKRSEKQMLRELLAIFGQRAFHWPEHYIELDLHCIQFQLCEFDKYERVRLGEGRPRNKYKRFES